MNHFIRHLEKYDRIQNILLEKYSVGKPGIERCFFKLTIIHSHCYFKLLANFSLISNT